MKSSLAKLDVVRIFDAVGGPAKLLALLDRWQPGHRLNYPRVHMWRQRNVIPGQYMLAVLYLLEEAGHGHWRNFMDDEEARHIRAEEAYVRQHPELCW